MLTRRVATMCVTGLLLVGCATDEEPAAATTDAAEATATAGHEEDLAARDDRIAELEAEVADLTDQLVAAEDAIQMAADDAAETDEADDAEAAEAGNMDAAGADPEDTGDDTDEPEGAAADRHDPIALGDTGSLPTWDVTVAEPMHDMTDAALAENEFNDPPEDGRSFYGAVLEVTYTGEDSEDPWLALELAAVGDAATAYTTHADTCGVTPDDITDIGELFTDGTGTALVCWSIPDDDADTVVLRVQESLTWEETDTWLALR